MTNPSSFHHFYKEIDGFKFHYVDEGNQTSPPLVLCHGFPDFWWGWRRQIPALVSAGFRVIVPDLPGFGETDKPKELEHYGFKKVSQQLIALLDLLGLQKATFLGHDWGGVLIWAVCLFYPDRVNGVASVCSPYSPRRDTFIPLEQLVEILPNFGYQTGFVSGKWDAQYNQNVEKFLSFLLRKYTEKVSSGWIKTGSFEDLPDCPPTTLMPQSEFNYHVETYKKSGFNGGFNWYKTRKINWEQSKGIPITINHPALMITVGKDPILSANLSANMEKYIPNLKRGHVEEAGHWVLLEKTEEVNQILIPWLKGLYSKL
eukprot:TRINITY_DN417_c0_g2_i1.p1 TRINITY_DN417_c0_g2~~TRINITY_DN417_c0_g2_i1.p1  ORF type:complete len:316 (-),score=48.58 TRINITY_DN417_c0_g2_i1:34-981(-)